jgi:hypothetical protein
MTPLFIVDFINKSIDTNQETMTLLKEQLACLPEDSAKHVLWLYAHAKQQQMFLEEKLKNLIKELERNASKSI